MKQITKGQLTKIHVLLNQCNMIEQKADLVNGFSNNRTESSKELTEQEARLFIQYLTQFDELEPLRRKVFAMAYNAGIIYGDAPDDKKINPVKLNMFLKKQGTVKKPLNSMKRDELTKTISQFEMIVKHQKEAPANKEAAAATSSLLSELNLSVQPARKRQARKNP